MKATSDQSPYGWDGKNCMNLVVFSCLSSFPLSCCMLGFLFQDIQRHVLGRLRSLLFGSEADADSTGEVLEYFMRRLSSVQTAERDSAVKVEYLLLCETQTEVKFL